MNYMAYLIPVLFFISVVMIVLSFAKPQSSEETSSRLDYLREKQGHEKAEKPKLAEQGRERLEPIAMKLLPEAWQQSLRIKLDKAGKYNAPVSQYAVNTLVFMLGFPLVFVLLNEVLLAYDNQVVLYAVPALAALGYYYPMIRLNTEIESRRQAIFRALPDFIDLLSVALEAGMGLDQSLNLVVRKTKSGPLTEELDQTLKEIRVGKTRAQALKDLAKRLDMKEVTSFVVAVVQAEQIGSNLSNTLRIQSEIARESRWQKAQELAQKAPVKMLFPMLLLIFPNIFLMIFGPLLLAFMLGKL